MDPFFSNKFIKRIFSSYERTPPFDTDSSIDVAFSFLSNEIDLTRLQESFFSLFKLDDETESDWNLI